MKLSNNFNFIYNDDFKISDSEKSKKWKEELVSLLEKIEEINDVENTATNIRKALEYVCNGYANINFNEDSERAKEVEESKLSEKIEYIKNFESKSLFNSLYIIKNTANENSHAKTNFSFKNKTTRNDIITMIKSLYVVIINLFKNIESVPKDFEFKYDVYDREKDKSISAISNSSRSKNIEFETVYKNLKIDHDNIFNWLSIKNSQIIIPIYQRKYNWLESNISILIKDIQKRVQDGQPHYFGTIAQKKQLGETNKDNNLIKIIDGQQRITTSLLIFLAASRLIENEFKVDINTIDWYCDIWRNGELKNYIYNPGSTEELNISFKNIMNNKFDPTIDIAKTQYENNYSFIYKELKKVFIDEKRDFIGLSNFMITFLHNFQVATINFNSNEFNNKSEMEIFENLNSKGLELKIDELIKNHIFNYCSDELLKEKHNEIVIAFNSVVTESCIPDDKLTEFYELISEIVNGSELPSEKSKRFIFMKKSLDDFFGINEEFTQIQDFKKFTIRMTDFLSVYSEILDISKAVCFTDSLSIINILNIVNDKKKKRFYIYFAYLLILAYERVYNTSYKYKVNEYIKLNKSELISIKNLYIEITKYIIRTKVISKQGDSNIKREMIKISNKIFKTINNINSIEEFCKISINLIKETYKSENYEYSKFKTNLINNSSENQIIDLLKLTEMYMSDSLFDVGDHIIRKTQSIEHILPKNPDEWTQCMNDQEKQEFMLKFDMYLNKIGNYLILTNSKNSKAKNWNFQRKQDLVYHNLNSPLYKNANEKIDVSGKKFWNFEFIEQRTTALIEYILNNVISE